MSSLWRLIRGCPMPRCERRRTPESSIAGRGGRRWRGLSAGAWGTWEERGERQEGVGGAGRRGTWRDVHHMPRARRPGAPSAAPSAPPQLPPHQITAAAPATLPAGREGHAAASSAPPRPPRPKSPAGRHTRQQVSGSPAQGAGGWRPQRWTHPTHRLVTRGVLQHHQGIALQLDLLATAQHLHDKAVISHGGSAAKSNNAPPIQQSQQVSRGDQGGGEAWIPAEAARCN